MDIIQKTLLEEVAGLHEVPEGAYNIRANGELDSRRTTANINIVTKQDKPGIDIIIAPGTKHESVHIPVIISQTGLKDLVYNDFIVGEDADVTIVAGCGIHNGGGEDSAHDGIHSFYLGRNAKVRYVEKHYGSGDGNGRNTMNPTTIIELADGASMEMETVQIKGIDSTTSCNVHYAGAVCSYSALTGALPASPECPFKVSGVLTLNPDTLTPPAEGTTTEGTPSPDTAEDPASLAAQQTPTVTCPHNAMFFATPGYEIVLEQQRLEMAMAGIVLPQDPAADPAADPAVPQE